MHMMMVFVITGLFCFFNVISTLFIVTNHYINFQIKNQSARAKKKQLIKNLWFYNLIIIIIIVIIIIIIIIKKISESNFGNSTTKSKFIIFKDDGVLENG